MAGRKEKVIEITTEEFKRFKLNGFKDTEIARLCNVSLNTLIKWKKEHGLVGIQNYRSIVDPRTTRGEKKLKELLKRIKELRAAYWDNKSIARELEIAPMTLYRLIDKYLPEEKRKAPIVFTDEQNERIEKSGLKRDTILSRMYEGEDFDTAVDTPLKRNIFFTKEQLETMKEKGIHRATVRSRMKDHGMSFETAVNTPLKFKKGIRKNGTNKRSS